MESVFPREAIERFASAYPLRPTHLTHCLADHPLLELDALAALAARMDPYTLEHNAAVDLPLGISNAETPANGLTALDSIAQIDRCGSWVLLKHIQQDPAYADLLHGVLGQLKDIVEPATGPMLQLEGFIFISSPNAITPPHFDPEYNILFQIRGSKTMTIFPASDREIVPQQFHEQYFCGGPRNLPWQERFGERGQPFHIKPGEAIYNPILWPHWVKTHDEVSISMSLTWRTHWSFHHADAQRLNATLRKVGINPAEPRPYPRSNLMKSVAHRALKKAGLGMGRSKNP